MRAPIPGFGHVITELDKVVAFVLNYRWHQLIALFVQKICYRSERITLVLEVLNNARQCLYRFFPVAACIMQQNDTAQVLLLHHPAKNGIGCNALFPVVRVYRLTYGQIVIIFCKSHRFQFLHCFRL